MGLVFLEDISINPGAPSPKILSSDSALYLLFYSHNAKRAPDLKQGRDSVSDKGVAIVEFEQVLTYKFGLPNDETLTGHPLYKQGLKYYAGQYFDNSPWIEEMIKINSVHPYHDPTCFKNCKHYVFTFHDNTFECIADGYKVKYKHKAMHDLTNEVLQEIFIAEI